MILSIRCPPQTLYKLLPVLEAQEGKQRAHHRSHYQIQPVVEGGFGPEGGHQGFHAAEGIVKEEPGRVPDLIAQHPEKQQNDDQAGQPHLVAVVGNGRTAFPPCACPGRAGSRKPWDKKSACEFVLAYDEVYWIASAWSFIPSAEITFRIVSKLGILSPESAL